MMLQRIATILIGLMMSSSALAQAPAAPTPASPAPAARTATPAPPAPNAPKPPVEVAATALSPDVLSAKTLLEDLIVKRYSMELATRVSKEAFSMSAQLDLTLVPQEEVKAVEPISDLMIGTIDPEALMKKFTGNNANDATAALLSQYRIRTVNLSVGLNPDLGEEKKNEINKVLSDRLKAEFDSNGKVQVSFIQSPPIKEKAKTWLDWLKDLQDLAGQIVIALALVLGALLWGMLAKPKESGKDSLNLSMTTDAAKTPNTQDMVWNMDRRQKEQDNYGREITYFKEQLIAMVPKISNSFDSLVRNWCQQGETGRVRLACFAEAVGRDLGRLPIPADAMADLTKIFNQMPNINLKEKRDALQRAYWDVMATLNLGVESLNQPFSYMGGLNVNTVNQVLMQQNPKMRTMVAVYLPDDLRSRYLKSLDTDAKRELLTSAANLSTVPAEELRSLDSEISQKIMGSNKGRGDVVEFETTLQKVIPGLTPIEQATMLQHIQGPAMQAYKASTPSLAFLDQWPDDALVKLIAIANIDELVAYLRVRPELEDRFLKISAPLTAQMAKDELSRNDNLSDNEKNRLLENFVERIRFLQDAKEIDLEAIFAQAGSSPEVVKAA